MKRIQLIVFIPIILGIGLIAGGAISGNSVVMMAGIPVLFGGSFLCALITTLVVIIKAVREVNSENTKSGSTKESGSYSNSSRTSRRESRSESAERQISNAAKVYKNAPNGDKVKGCIFVLSFIGCLIGGMVLMTIGYEMAGGIVFGCAFLIIIGAAIISTSAQRRSMSRHYKPEDYVKKQAVVESCHTASTTEVNGRITKVIYCITVNAGGEYHDVYGTEELCRGDKVEVLIHKNGKIAKLVDTVISHNDGYDDYEDDDYDSDDDYDEDELGTSDKYKEMSQREQELFDLICDECNDDTYDLIYDRWQDELIEAGNDLSRSSVVTARNALIDKYRKLLVRYDNKRDENGLISLTEKQVTEFLNGYDGSEEKTDEVPKKTKKTETSKTPEPPAKPDEPKETEPIVTAAEPDIAETPAATEKPADHKRPNVGYKGIIRKK